MQINFSNKTLIVLILGFLFLLLFPFPEFKTNFSWDSTCDALHLPLFFLACLALFNYLKSNKALSEIRAAKLAFFYIFSLGLIIEFIQPLFDRGFSIKDIITNFFGSALLYLSVSKKHSKYILITILLAFGFVTIPIVEDYFLYKQRQVSFPTLFSPSSRLISIAKPVYGAKILTHTQVCSFLISPSKKSWSGVSFNMGYSNWERYKTLSIELQNPSTYPISLGLRIDDDGDVKEFSSRFNSEMFIPPNKLINLEIPINSITNSVKNRTFNITKIKRLLIFKLDSDSDYCIGNIELK